MKSAGVNPAEKPSTGQDATVAGIQRILAGEQYMTVYKAVEPEASAAAQLAVALAQGKKPDPGKIASSLGKPGTMLRRLGATLCNTCNDKVGQYDTKLLSDSDCAS